MDAAMDEAEEASGGIATATAAVEAEVTGAAATAGSSLLCGVPIGRGAERGTGARSKDHSEEKVSATSSSLSASLVSLSDASPGSVALRDRSSLLTSQLSRFHAFSSSPRLRRAGDDASETAARQRMRRAGSRPVVN